MTYGVVETGFNKRTTEDIYNYLKDRWVSRFGEYTIGSDVDYDITTTARLLGETWETIEGVYHLMSRDNAFGINLDNLLALILINRTTPTKSTVTLTLGTNGTSDVTIPAGNIVRQSANSVQWFTLTEVTIPASGTVTVQAESENYGNYTASIGTIDTIVTPISGWDTVTNLSEALAGDPEETDVEYKLKAEREIVTSQGGILDAIVTRVKNEVSGVTYCTGKENNTDNTDANGLLPHSIMITVVGGNDDAIAEKIRETKGDGINTNGSEEIELTDPNGNPITIRFNRAEIIDIFVTYELNVTSDYDTSFNDTIKDTVESYSDSLLEGKDIRRWELESLIPMNMNDNIIDISVKFGTSASPTTNTAIEITNSQKARILRSNIVINTTVI